MHTPLPKRYRFVATHPQAMERVDFHSFGRGVVHARFGGESVWGSLGLEYHGPYL